MRVVSQGGGSLLVNELPVDVMLLTFSPASKTFVTVRVPAKGESTLSSPSATAVSLEPIAVEVGIPQMFRTCTVSSARQAENIQAIVDKLN